MPHVFDAHGLAVLILVGLIAGWLAGQIMHGGGFGLVGNLVVGILGAIVGDYLFRFFGLAVAHGIVGAIIRASIGAVVLLFLIGLVKK